MQIKYGEISNQIKQKIKKLEQEVFLHGGYEKWYYELEDFRKQLEPYGKTIITPDGRKCVVSRNLRLPNGHYIDHHISGYFAPLEFKRIGFEYEKRTPAEQLIYLSKYLQQREIRFIYVPLPCKKAVYPELVVDNSVIPQDRIVIPQWRKMIREALEGGVEVLDLYPEFLENKQNMLYAYEHNISPQGAILVGKKIAEYLDSTIDFESKEREFISESKRTEIAAFNGWKRDEMFFYPGESIFTWENNRMKPVTGCDVSSEILLIGDCNTQGYMQQGASVTAHLSHHLKYPIEYGGRCLAFDPIDRINTIEKGKLSGKKVLIYVGFVSASYVRSIHPYNLWSGDCFYDSAFSDRDENM